MKKGRNTGDKDPDGENLWLRVTEGMKAYSPPKKTPPAPQPRAQARPAPLQSAPLRGKPELSKPEGFDRATETKLRRGQLPLEGRLDLHGMTQAEAFDALYRFVISAAARGKRTVLVITGKGVRMEGVLKKMLPLWLEDPELGKHILAVTPAQPKDGGSGAFYLRLRKQKNS